MSIYDPCPEGNHTPQRKVEKIQAALEGVYGKGSMVTALAQHLLKKWPAFEDEEADGWRDVEYNVMLTIWNWFPGGGTAEIAAGRVMEALR